MKLIVQFSLRLTRKMFRIKFTLLRERYLLLMVTKRCQDEFSDLGNVGVFNAQKLPFLSIQRLFLIYDIRSGDLGRQYTDLFNL